MEQIEEKIAPYKQLVRVGKPCSDEDIETLAKKLNTPIPNTLKSYLLKWGIFSFDSETFYGLTEKKFEAKSAPCIYFLTLQARQRGDISKDMIKIKSSGYGPSFCIDMSKVDENKEGVVVEVPLSYKRDGIATIVANNFEEFLKEEIEYVIEDLEDEN